MKTYTIVERPYAYAGAIITVEFGRDTFGPQCLGYDAVREACAEHILDAVREACAEHILDAVREAFPGAEVVAVGNGGRTSATMPDGEDFTREVREVVTQAFDTFDWG